MLASGSLVPDELWRLVVKIADRPGVLKEIMVALGDANINIEDLALHHMSAELGGSLTVYVLRRRRSAGARRSCSPASATRSITGKVVE